MISPLIGGLFDEQGSIWNCSSFLHMRFLRSVELGKKGIFLEVAIAASKYGGLRRLYPLDLISLLAWM